MYEQRLTLVTFMRLNVEIQYLGEIYCQSLLPIQSVQSFQRGRICLLNLIIMKGKLTAIIKYRTTQFVEKRYLIKVLVQHNCTIFYAHENASTLPSHRRGKMWRENKPPWLQFVSKCKGHVAVCLCKIIRFWAKIDLDQWISISSWFAFWIGFWAFRIAISSELKLRCVCHTDAIYLQKMHHCIVHYWQ